MSSHGRPIRSSSIPIPPTPGRHNESVLSIPFTGSSSGPLTRSRPTTSALGVRGHVTLAGTSPSSSRHTPSHSFTNLPLPYGSPTTLVEPRRIRANGGTGSSRSLGDNGFSSPSSPAIRRRQSSSSGHMTSIGSGARRPSSHRTASSSYTAAPSLSPQTIVAFPPPSYLSNSSLRHLLQTEAPPSLPPSRYSMADASAAGANVVWPYAKQRELTPATDSEEDSNDSPPPRELGLPPAVLISSSPILRLPTRWSDQDRNPSLSVSSDGRDLTFNGPATTGDKDAAAARTNHPIPPACGIYYYEVEILNKGQRGSISIGLGAGGIRLSRIPGWEGHSWGYRGEDGLSFAAEKTGTPYGPRFEEGDIIGCGIDFSQYRAFFTRNGAFLGNVFENVGKNCDLYPCVALRHLGESIRVNFGHEAFKFDIEDHVQQQRNLIWASIQSTPIALPLLGRLEQPGGSKLMLEDGFDERTARLGGGGGAELDEAERVRTPMGMLVSEYLEHHGYAKTARALKRQFDNEGRSGTGGDRRGGTSTTRIPDDDAPVPVPVPIYVPSLTVDEDMDMDDVVYDSESSCAGSSSLPDPIDDLETRLRVVNAVVAGDIDTAIDETAKHYPRVLDEEDGFMRVKLRCRKFVELVLEAGEAMKKLRELERKREKSRASAMDVDDSDALPMPAPGTNGFSSGPTPAFSTNGDTKPAFSPSNTSPAVSAATALYQSALLTALTYGQKLRADYKEDGRLEVQALFKRTFGIVAYEDPASVGGEIAEVVGQEARAALANELNVAILKSQGRPSHPALERLYRQAAACVVQLGLLGVGTAAFADMSKEFLDA